MISACVDIGTNTVLLLVARATGEDFEVLEDTAQVVRLGEGVDTNRRFHPEALKRLASTLEIYDQRCKELGAQQRMAVATSATRDVSDSSRVTEICGSYGFPLKILSGEEEAEYTFKGAVSSGAGTKFVIDIGGGSTEIICGDDSGRKFEKSFNVGAVRMTERFVSTHPVPPAELDRLREFLKDEFSDLPRAARGDQVIAVAGTPTTLAALDMSAPFDRSRVHGYTLSEETLERWVARLAGMNLKDRLALPGMQPGREDVIVAGAAILAETLKALQVQSAKVSDRGLRYGVLKCWKELNP